MMMYDGFWFPEPVCHLPGVQATTASTTATPCLSSPSSGYSSADEGRATPVGPGGWPLAAAALESSGWASPSDCLLSSDPYLGELVGRSGVYEASATVSTGTSSWSGTNVGLDDLMDTLWDSLNGGIESAQRPGEWCELMADGSFTKQYPMTTTTTTTTSYGFSGFSNSYNTAFGMASGTVGENSLVDLVASVDDGLRTSASGSVFVGQPLTVVTDRHHQQGPGRRAGGLQQHMAGLISDMATGDADDYLLQQGATAGTVVAASHGSPRPGGRRLLAGVRTPTNSVLHAAASTSSRVRGAVLAKSCGDGLLQRAAVGLSTSTTPVQPSATGRTPAAHSGRTPAAPFSSAPPRTRSTGPHQSAARVTGIRPSMSSARLSDVRGSGAAGSISRVASYPALDDHRYTLKAPPPPTQQAPPSKIQKTGARSSAMRQSANLVGVTSILEAFLRSTRPMDANKGSNAVLATAGLAHLPLTGSGAAATATAERRADDEAAGTLLKKLLTGQMDQGDVVGPPDATGTESTLLNNDEQAASSSHDDASSLNVDCMLAEGFGLDADFCLDDPQAMNINLLDDVTDDGLWITTDTDDFFDDKLMSSELDEILREQNRQDDLWLQHYVTELF